MDIDLSVLRLMERERDIPFDELVQIIEQAIHTAYLNHIDQEEHISGDHKTDHKSGDHKVGDFKHDGRHGDSGCRPAHAGHDAGPLQLCAAIRLLGANGDREMAHR